MNPYRISEPLKPRDNEMIALVLFYLCGEFAAQQCRPKTPGIQGASMLVKLTLILMAWYFFFEPPPFILPLVILQLLQEEMLLGLIPRTPSYL